MTRPPRFPMALERVHAKPRGRAAAAGTELLRPQRPLHHAAEQAARLSPSSGLGLDSAAVRQRMVDRLRANGIRHEGLLQAFAAVERHRFVDTALATQAYEDTSLPIGLQQTISKPSVVARMLELLRQRPGGPQLGRVLEIGTGCGYQAAVLVKLARNVYSVERLRGLYDRARENLAPMRPDHLRLIFGDGRLGHGPNAPYDGIIAAAGGEQVPAAWIEQLAPGGRLVAPVHDVRLGQQVLQVVDRRADGQCVWQQFEAVRFVPLESGTSNSC